MPDVLEIICAGLDAARIENVMDAAVREGELEGYDHVYVVGFGKASSQMAYEIEKRFGDLIDSGVVISSTDPGLEKVGFRKGSHPLPSEANVAASREILEIVSGAGECDLILCLISGGGSSMFTCPHVPLKDYVGVNRELLRSGAPIEDVNCVRKHLDEVKGGGLAAHLRGAGMLCLIVSDVVGDRLDTIASGPAYPDESTYADAEEVVQKYGLGVPETVSDHLRRGLEGGVAETLKDGDPVFEDVENRVVAGNQVARSAACEKARELGYQVTDLGELEGEASDVGKEHAKMLASMNEGDCVISGGETTVTVKGDGKGGRNREYVLSFLAHADGIYEVGAADTDGADGTDSAAGAWADEKTAEKSGLDPVKYLRRNDSETFFERVGTAVKTGPTGTNVNDVRVFLKKKTYI